MIKKLLALFVAITLLLIPLAIYWPTEPVPTVGTPAPAEYTPHPHGALASSTEIYPTLISPGGSYRVGVDSSNTVRLVFPTGNRFSTPDGISTSSSFADVQAVTNSPVIPDGKFGYTVRLPSGWVARFDGAPTLETRVASVFSR